MPVSYKVLGQSAPEATTNTTLYTVPSNTQSIVSTLSVVNRAAATATYRIAIRPDGASIANQHYLAYDITIAANDTTILTTALSMDANDILTVYASSASITFGAYGSEIS
jgi:hypothetical protein